MTNRYIAFDIEISKVLAAGETDWKAQRPLGISCAATLMSDRDEPKLWYSCDPFTGQPLPSMTVKDVQDLIFYLRLSVKTGYKILTWNGLSFDFDVLAEESISMADLCVDLALNHIDMMFHVFALRGHYLGLDKAAKGMGLIGKLNGGTRSPFLSTPPVLTPSSLAPFLTVAQNYFHLLCTSLLSPLQLLIYYTFQS